HPAALLAPPGEQRLGAGVRLQAAERAAAAAAAPDAYRQVPPFDGPAVFHLGGGEAGADPGAEEDHEGAAGAPPGPEPHLGLSEGPGAVDDEAGDGAGQQRPGAQQGFEGDRVPADGLAVHDGAPVRGVLDDAGDTDADAEQACGGEAGRVEHVGDAGADVVDDDLDVVAPLLQRALGAGHLGQGEVEQFDADAGLPHVHADQVPAERRHPQQGAGPAAVGVHAARLLDQAVGDQVGHHVAHRAGAEPGRRAEFEAAEGAVEVQPLEDGRAVGPPEVPHRASAPPRHTVPSHSPAAPGPPGPAPVRPATYRHVTERDVLRHLSHAVNRPAGRAGGAPPARRKTVRGPCAASLRWRGAWRVQVPRSRRRTHETAHRAGHPQLVHQLLQGRGQAPGGAQGPGRTALGGPRRPGLAGPRGARPQPSRHRARRPAGRGGAALPAGAARIPAPQHVLPVPDHPPPRGGVPDDRPQRGRGRPRGQLGGRLHVHRPGLLAVPAGPEGAGVRGTVRGEPHPGGADRPHQGPSVRLPGRAARLSRTPRLRPPPGCRHRRKRSRRVGKGNRPRMREVRELAAPAVQFVKRRRDPVAVQTLRSTAAATVAYVIAVRLSPEAAPLTAPLTALLVVQVTLFSTLTTGVRRVNAVVAGVVVAILFSLLVGLTWWSLGLLILASLLVGHLVRVNEFVPEVAISAMLVLGVTHHGDTAWARIVETLIGAV